MNLYLISQDENSNYDTYDSAVVAADSEDAARNTLPHPAEYEPKWKDGEWASSPDKVKVKLIGSAVEGTEAGVICASYNAG